MIDVKARDRMCELLRHLTAGVITNDQFEDDLPRTIARFDYGAWPLYSI
jgi:hypothetical protein